ncbi:CYTH-like domain, partial [Trinorchestia longiramus]
IKRMISMVCQKIGIDTGDRLKNNARKLKYLVLGPLPSVDKFPKFQDFTVEHIYLRTNSRKMQARIRKRGADGRHSYTYTIRKPEKLGQIVEVRTQVTQRDWNTAKGQADDQHFPIYKTRRCFLHNDQYFQLDIYREPCHKRCHGLMLLETYTTLTAEEMATRRPSFLNIDRDVTGNPEYSMFNLSLRDDWENTTKFCVNIAGKEDRGMEDKASGADSLDAEETRLRAEWEQEMGANDSEWDFYQKKIVKSLSSDSATGDDDDDKLKIKNGEDDQFYEDMDKKYNANRVLNHTPAKVNGIA